MQRYALNVSYLGRKYNGWQKSSDPNVKSVQGALEKAMERFMGGIKSPVYGSGRTDAGVHAANQVVHVDIIYQVPPRHQALQSSTSSPTTSDRVADHDSTTPASAPSTDERPDSIYAYRQSAISNLASWRHFCNQQEDRLRKIYPKKLVKAVTSPPQSSSTATSDSHYSASAVSGAPQRQGGKRKSRHDVPINPAPIASIRTVSNADDSHERVNATSISIAPAYASLPRELPTLVAVRVLPVAPPVCVIAASAAIDVVKKDKQHKYSFSYSRLCVMGLRGVRSVHCTLGLCKFLHNPENEHSQPELDVAAVRCSNDYYRTPCSCGLSHDEVIQGINYLENKVANLETSGKNDAKESNSSETTSSTEDTAKSSVRRPAAPYYINKYHKLLLDKLSAPTVYVNKGINITSLRPTPEKAIFRKILNEYLSEDGNGEDITVNDVTPVPRSFHARFDPYRRRYIYRVLISPNPDLYEQGRVWHIRAPSASFDTARAAYVAEALMGRYDFNSFRHVHCQARSPIRSVDKVELAWEPSFREKMQGFPLHYDVLSPPVPDTTALDLGKTASGKEYVSDSEKFERALSGMGLDVQNAFVSNVNNAMFGYDQSKLIAVPPNSVFPEKTRNPERNPEEELRTQLNAGDLGFSAKEIEVINRFIKKTGLAFSSKDRAVPINPTTSASTSSHAASSHTTSSPPSINALSVYGEKPAALAAVSSSSAPFLPAVASGGQEGFQGSVLTISVVARAFLHSQVRIMVGAIVDAGFGAYNHLDIHDNLNRRDRGKNPVQTAPPDGLFLTNVMYPYGEYKHKFTDLQRFEYDMLLCSNDKGNSLSVESDVSAVDEDFVQDVVRNATAAAQAYGKKQKEATE